MSHDDAARTNRVAGDRIGPDDPRYDHLNRRGFNKRFVGAPRYIRQVGCTEQVIDALQDAVREGMRVVARSGGHCLEGFVGDPGVQVIIDTSAMTGVWYDAERRAFAIEAGTSLGEAYQRLYQGWWVMLPAGQSPEVGIGGHVAGGAHGFMHREHGLAADHLYAVEVVVIDERGVARGIIATREADDPHRDLWWAHTGGGGGNFGIVTRYWFRSSGADGDDPRGLLPRAPESVLVFRATWDWKALDEATLTRLTRRFGGWCELHGAPDAPERQLFSTMYAPRRAGIIDMKGLATGSIADHLVDDFMTALQGDGAAPAVATRERLPWLRFAPHPFPELFVLGLDNVLMKGKDALLRQGLSDAQIHVAHGYLAAPEHGPVGGMLALGSYGGQVNALSPDATATAARHASINLACVTGWGDPSGEPGSVAWVRSFYRDLFADTGGVPVPGIAYDGAMINHPDADLADSAWNRSGVPWSAIYYQENYPRLQQVKRRYDPGNVFHHALSIRVSVTP